MSIKLGPLQHLTAQFPAIYAAIVGSPFATPRGRIALTQNESAMFIWLHDSADWKVRLSKFNIGARQLVIVGESGWNEASELIVLRGFF